MPLSSFTFEQDNTFVVKDSKKETIKIHTNVKTRKCIYLTSNVLLVPSRSPLRNRVYNSAIDIFELTGFRRVSRGGGGVRSKLIQISIKKLIYLIRQ